MPIKQGKLILVGNPDKLLYFAKNAAEKKKMMEQYGWMNPDYRPTEVAESVLTAISKPDEYFPFVFRHLSSTIVGGYSWKATEFSDKVLKAAAQLLTYKPVYVNHELETSNIVGVNGKIEFVSGYTAPDGTRIPGGLEGPIWIDGLLHQDLTRKLSAHPIPHIQSVSVSVTYNWEPSHEFTNRDGQPDEWEFENRIGTMVDGKMVRRMVTEIIDFYETSLVFLGADPYAKILDEKGNPINVEKSAIVGVKEFSKDPLVDLYKKENLMFIEEQSMSKENLLHLIERVSSSFSKTGNSKHSPSNANSKMEKIIAALAKKLNKPEADITAEMVESYTFVSTADYTAMKTAADSAPILKTGKETAEASLLTANETIGKLTKIAKVEDLVELEKIVPLESIVEFAKSGKSKFDKLKAEVVRLYKLTVGEGKEDAAILATFEKADEPALSAFHKQYGGKAIEQFGGSCVDCGSEHITFRKSVEEGQEEKKDEVNGESMAEKFRR